MNWDEFASGVLATILVIVIFGLLVAMVSSCGPTDTDQEKYGKACADRGGKWVAVGYNNAPVWSCLDVDGKVK